MIDVLWIYFLEGFRRVNIIEIKSGIVVLMLRERKINDLFYRYSIIILKEDFWMERGGLLYSSVSIFYILNYRVIMIVNMVNFVFCLFFNN